MHVIYGVDVRVEVLGPRRAVLGREDLGLGPGSLTLWLVIAERSLRPVVRGADQLARLSSPHRHRVKLDLIVVGLNRNRHHDIADVMREKMGERSAPSPSHLGLNLQVSAFHYSVFLTQYAAVLAEVEVLWLS